eukprot:6501604-Ditylum_brightwellii.AAC.1
MVNLFLLGFLEEGMNGWVHTYANHSEQDGIVCFMAKVVNTYHGVYMVHETACGAVDTLEDLLEASLHGEFVYGNVDIIKDITMHFFA